MSRRGAARIRSWLLFLAAFAFIVATLDVAFETSLFLRSRGYLWHTVKLLFCATATVVGYLLVVRARITRPLVYLRAAPALALFGYAMVALRSSPSERFHFVEYGALYLIALRAIVIDVRGLSAYLVALPVTAAAGWLDEFLQGLSPVRYYDVADIRINALAAAVAGIVFFSLFGRRPTLARFDAWESDTCESNPAAA